MGETYAATSIRYRSDETPRTAAALGQGNARPTTQAPQHTFLRRFLAFEIQARQTGGLPKSFDKKLAATAKLSTSRQPPSMQPGARLLREWNGITHVIDVTEDGYLWRGTLYRSLSSVARAITGAHWSGPRFFGLTGKTRS